jgi:hypothetical protein
LCRNRMRFKRVLSMAYQRKDKKQKYEGSAH